MDEHDIRLFRQITKLPRPDWDENWDRIYVDDNLKHRVLNYFLLLNQLRRSDVSRMALAQHGIVLFYGPPGTGKTTLARGLANKVATEFQAENRSTLYVEVDANQLSSRWLGEGPKMISLAFERIEELASTFATVICLFDEVESLITNRALALNDTNPVDVFRSVNTVFQHVDALAALRNVFIISTSNLTKAIDQAFLDRSDASYHVGLPTLDARHLIFQDVIGELAAKLGLSIDVPKSPPAHDWHPWAILLQETAGFSGRQLRKLVAESFTSSAELARSPHLLQLDHIIAAARHNRQRLKRDAAVSGVYQTELDGVVDAL